MITYQTGSENGATIINGYEFYLEGAEYNINPTWKGLSQRGHIYAWKVTDHWGKPKIAVWVPDVCSPSVFDETQKCIPYCEQNLNGLRDGSIMRGEQEVIF